MEPPAKRLAGTAKTVQGGLTHRFYCFRPVSRYPYSGPLSAEQRGGAALKRTDPKPHIFARCQWQSLSKNRDPESRLPKTYRNDSHALERLSE